MTTPYERMAKVLKNNEPYYWCIACQKITTPINCGEAQSQRCEHCDSSRIAFYDRPLVPEYGREG